MEDNDDIIADLGEGGFGKVFDIYNFESKSRKVVKIFSKLKNYLSEKETYLKIE